MTFEHVHNVYFIGIGGIGMSALARYFRSRGKLVAGYDKTPTTLTGELQAEGIRVNHEDELSAIPSDILDAPGEDVLIVYTPAIPGNNNQLNYFRSKDYHVIKRAQVLGQITEGHFTIAVAGAHGKTSTVTLVSHLLRTAGIPCYAFLGGISTNYNTNFIQPDHDQESAVMVVEADEFDRSFLQLNPDIAILTSIDADHLDVYGNEETLRNTYYAFLGKVKMDGFIVHNLDIPMPRLPENTNTRSFAFDNPGADYYSSGLQVENHQYVFDVNTPSGLKHIKLGTPGDHYVMNALAALAATSPLIRDWDTMQKALETFRGVKRRFEYILDEDPVVYIDDYAHHPTEIAFTINTLRKLYPGEGITGIFQPHLYSRTRDFADGFARVLSGLNRVILLEIYPAREEPISGINSGIILERIHRAEKELASREELPDRLRKDGNRIIITLGAGDIDQLVAPVKEVLTKERMN